MTRAMRALTTRTVCRQGGSDSANRTCGDVQNSFLCFEILQGHSLTETYVPTCNTRVKYRADSQAASSDR